MDTLEDTKHFCIYLIVTFCYYVLTILSIGLILNKFSVSNSITGTFYLPILTVVLISIGYNILKEEYGFHQLSVGLAVSTVTFVEIYYMIGIFSFIWAAMGFVFGLGLIIGGFLSIVGRISYPKIADVLNIT